MNHCLRNSGELLVLTRPAERGGLCVSVSIPFKQRILELQPMLDIDPSWQSRNIRFNTYGLQHLRHPVTRSVVRVPSSEHVRKETLSRDRRAALEIAGLAHGFDVKRLVVVAMVIDRGLASAINTLERRWNWKRSVLRGSTNHVACMGAASTAPCTSDWGTDTAQVTQEIGPASGYAMLGAATFASPALEQTPMLSTHLRSPHFFGFANRAARIVLNIIRRGGPSSNAVGIASDRPSGITDVCPVDIGPEIFNSNPATSSALNVDTLVGRNRALAVAPLLDGGRFHSDSTSEGGLAAYDFACHEDGLLSGRVHEN